MRQCLPPLSISMPPPPVSTSSDGRRSLRAHWSRFASQAACRDRRAGEARRSPRRYQHRCAAATWGDEGDGLEPAIARLSCQAHVLLEVIIGGVLAFIDLRAT